jgi:hypothetical protein
MNARKNYMPIQGCFAFIDWEPRFARAELCLIADTPDHGLWPAAPIVLGDSIEEGMRAAMGDYMGLAAAIGAPRIPTDAVEKLGPATARAAEPIVSLCLYLCSEEPAIAGMLPSGEPGSFSCAQPKPAIAEAPARTRSFC